MSGWTLRKRQVGPVAMDDINATRRQDQDCEGHPEPHERRCAAFAGQSNINARLTGCSTAPEGRLGSGTPPCEKSWRRMTHVGRRVRHDCTRARHALRQSHHGGGRRETARHNRQRRTCASEKPQGRRVSARGCAAIAAALTRPPGNARDRRESSERDRPTYGNVGQRATDAFVR
jgi:hypothetical protein